MCGCRAASNKLAFDALSLTMASLVSCPIKMILIGMFDSPFVRRVAVSAKLLGLSFEHRNWSVGKDADRIKQYNPQGRVPTLVLDDGEVLIESSAILDHFDQEAGPQRALLPASGAERRHALQLVSTAAACVDKGILLVFERLFRPADKRHPGWEDRCRGQMNAAMAVLDRACATLPGEWLTGDRLMQPDITLACAATYLKEAAGLELGRYPAAQKHVQRCEALPEFREFYAPFFTPQPQ